MRIVKNPRNSGFTLFQAIIGLATMSIMVMGCLSLFSSMLRQSKTVQTSAEFNQLRDELIGVIRNADLCSARLMGLDVSTGTVNLSINLPGSSRQIAAGSDYMNTWTIDKLAIEQVAPIVGGANPQMRSAVLNVRAQRKGFATKQVYGDQYKEDTFSLYFSVDASDKINGCVSSSENSVAEANCLTMGGTWDANKSPQCMLPNVAQNCAAFGGTFDIQKSPPCQLPNPCPDGEILMSYDSIGMPICQTMKNMMASACGNNEVVATDGNNNMICINKNSFPSF